MKHKIILLLAIIITFIITIVIGLLKIKSINEINQNVLGDVQYINLIHFDDEIIYIKL